MSEEIIAIIDINSGEGLGRIKFGMDVDEVEDLIGSADEKESYALESGESTESWHYDELELSISFVVSSQKRLVSVTTSSEDSILYGQEIVGMNKKELLKYLEKKKVSDVQFEDCSTTDTPDLKLYYSMNLAMNFWLEDGVVSDVEWGVKMDDKDQVIWPVY